MLTEQNVEEWVGQALKTIQKEIEILEEKIKEYKQKGKTQEVKRLEKELQKLRKSISDRERDFIQKGQPMPTGTLRLSAESKQEKKPNSKKKTGQE
jgi:hypothetical protein